jgi:hypothetical protein
MSTASGVANRERGHGRCRRVVVERSDPEDAPVSSRASMRLGRDELAVVANRCGAGDESESTATRRDTMAVGMFMAWPEVTVDLYEEARRRVDWEHDHPQGGLNHMAWFDGDGFHVVDVWESQQAFERFATERLMPVVKGDMQIPGEPQVRFAELHAHWAPPSAGKR